MTEEVLENEQNKNEEEIAAEIKKISAEDFLFENYLPFAHYTIQSRALTRSDGLKPVQRRILFQLWRTGKTSRAAHIKAQKVAGDVSGMLHPHGDCLHPDTQFLLTNGEAITFSEMVDKTTQNPKQSYHVYSVDKDGKLVESVLTHARIGQFAKEIYHIRFSNGEVIEATANHPFMRFDGTYTKAEDLKVNDFVKAFTFKEDFKEELLLFVESIEVQKHKNPLPMCDFTVEDYENALVYLPDTKSLVCVHNSSVAGAIARMGQDFSLRVPLIDVLGSVGFVTGDTPASPRYYEVRLTKAAEELVQEVDDDAVDMVPTYDGTGEEPEVLPARWPSLIINGTSGIAVGYASNMFSHNPTEAMDAAIALLNNEDLTVDELLEIMPGPDLPTGGEVIGTDGIRDYYETGSGTFVVRGRYKLKPLPRGKHQIVFYELPYQVSAEDVSKGIRKAQDKGKLKDVAEIKDLTDMKNGLRLSIITKAGANPNLVVAELFAETPCESKLSTNATALRNDGKPVVFSMIDLLKSFLALRRDCLIKKTNFRLDKIKEELSRLEGLLKVLLDIDAAIKIIRNSKDQKEANQKLCKKFKITSEQAEYILSMRLRTLTRSDSVEIEQKNKKLLKEQKDLEKILTSEKAFKEEIEKELIATREIIKDKRRTIIRKKSLESLKKAAKNVQKVEKELQKDVPITVKLTRDYKLYKTLDEKDDQGVMENKVLHTTSLSDLVGVKPNGDLVSIPVSTILLDSASETNVMAIGKEKLDKKNDVGLFMATNKGGVNIVKSGLRGDRSAINLDDDEEVIYAMWVTKEDYENKFVVMLSNGNKMVRFPLSAVRTSGVGAGSVIGMKLGKDEFVYAASVCGEDDQVLAWNDDLVKWMDISEIPVTNRNTAGVIFCRLNKGHKQPENFLTMESFTDINNKPNKAKRADSQDKISPTLLKDLKKMTPQL